jgi:adenylosuccinate synthase
VPISIVVGGQFGSEGKGKVAHHLARELDVAAAVRVGGPNSGHTVITPVGTPVIFRQLPTAAILDSPICVIAAGSYVDVDILLSEVERTGLTPERLVIDPHAMVISNGDRARERQSGLRERIGSTLSGTGSAVSRRITREAGVPLARNEIRLRPYVRSAIEVIRDLLDRGRRVLIEGTQGFGLSLLHGTDYPYVTSRDTTAAAFLSEVGMSPLDVDDIVLVIRAFPIRVPGESGGLPLEIDWPTLTVESGAGKNLVELTSVTRAPRRVARFDPGVVRQAIRANRPTRIVLNHLDYVDWEAGKRGMPTERVITFVDSVVAAIGCEIHSYGLSPSAMVPAR